MMRGLVDFYLSFLYKRRGSKLLAIYIFCLIILYILFFSTYYANISLFLHTNQINSYTDFIMYYLINWIFRFYELFFKGVTLYGSYFPTISPYRLGGGILGSESRRIVYGSQYFYEDNTFAQRRIPKFNFFFFFGHFVYFTLRRTTFVLKLFVKKQHNVFFFKFITICKLYFLFLFLIMFFIFGNDFQINNFVVVFFNLYKYFSDLFFVNFIEINVKYLNEIMSNDHIQEFNIFYVNFLDYFLGTNDSIWYQAQIYTTHFITRYILYFFLIFFKYFFSLIFLLVAIIFFFFLKFQIYILFFFGIYQNFFLKH